MIECAGAAEELGERGLRREAPLPRLPCLQSDNCIRTSRRKQLFVAQENLRLYIWKHGEQNIGSLTVTAADCLEAADFQSKWHSYLNALKKIFATGMWTRERQPRSGNWHAHAGVNVGWDIKTDFPRDQVQRGFYANVDPRLRQVWRYLREKATSHGFGRVELLPLKYSGAACARYFTKYLAKSLSSEKCSGEEKCRLFGVWGGVRFAYGRFTFLRSRITQKRKQWLAEILELSDETKLGEALGARWWFHFGRALCEVIMPEDFYKVGPRANRHFDDLGLRALERDWAAWPGVPSEDLMMRSQFNLFYDIGIRFFGRHSSQALDYALYVMEKRELVALVLRPADRQRHFEFQVRV
ncbi:MAG: hypothetical protein DME96_05445 [Verrucomicrobia bacterium]|nr:MAG: hypothetical protein DME96_05445 [Verrucomicrobiota bacterium]